MVTKPAQPRGKVSGHEEQEGVIHMMPVSLSFLESREAGNLVFVGAVLPVTSIPLLFMHTPGASLT